MAQKAGKRKAARPAKNTTGTGRKLFKKGQSGNPAGRPPGVPNKVTSDVKRFCSALLDHSEYQAKFTRAFVDRTLPPALEQLVWFYAAGKPKDTIDLKHSFPHKLLLGDAPPDTDD